MLRCRTLLLGFLVAGVSVACGRPSSPSTETPSAASPDSPPSASIEAEPGAAPVRTGPTDDLPWRDTGQYGDLIAPGRYRSTGQAGGDRDAATNYGELCEGWIDETPDHQLSVASDGVLHIEARPRDPQRKLGLVVVGYDASRCATALAPGSAAFIDGTFTAGVYEVYVAAARAEDLLAHYTVTMASDGATEAVPEEWTDTGEYGHLMVPGNYRARGIAGGSRAAGELSDGRCAGSIDTTPDHSLTVMSGVSMSVSVVPAEPSSRLSLVVVGASGTKCYEAAEDARVQQQIDLASGTYDLYIAALRPEDNTQASYSIAVQAEAAGSASDLADGWADTGPYGALGLPGPTRANGQSGGQVESEQVHGPECRGWIDTEPDHFLEIDTEGLYRIEARSIDANKNLTLVVVPVGRTGTICNDDRREGDMNPLVSGTLPAGNYGVYVGARTQEDQHAGYIIEARTEG